MNIRKLPTASFGMRYPKFFPQTRVMLEEKRQIINERVDVMIEDVFQHPLTKKILARVGNILKNR